jgi:hypothetical protein
MHEAVEPALRVEMEPVAPTIGPYDAVQRNRKHRVIARLTLSNHRDVLANPVPADSHA